MTTKGRHTPIAESAFAYLAGDKHLNDEDVQEAYIDQKNQQDFYPDSPFCVLSSVANSSVSCTLLT